MGHERRCTGRCMVMVRSIVEQVVAETDQWAQMQEMVAQVGSEMDELQASRHFWENRAYSLELEIRSLSHTLEEWKERAIRSENKAEELGLVVSALNQQIQTQTQTQTPDTDSSHEPPPIIPLVKRLEKEKKSFRLKKNKHAVDQKEHDERTRKKGLWVPLGKQLAKEKMGLLGHMKGSSHRRPHGDGDRERGRKRDVAVSGRRKKSCSSEFGISDRPSHSPLMIGVSSWSPSTRQTIGKSSLFAFWSPDHTEKSIKNEGKF